jgi:Uma2 family endonuclease
MEVARTPGYFEVMHEQGKEVRLTAEQYAQLPDDGMYIHEVSRGLLIRQSRPGALHARIAGRLHLLLHDYVTKNDLGVVEIEAGFRLHHEPVTVRGPDVAFISKQRVPPEVPTSWWPFAPDLAIEVVARDRRQNELQQKILEFFETGTREVWVVEPRARTVTVYQSLSDIRIVREPEELDGGDLLPGLRLPLSSFLP